MVDSSSVIRDWTTRRAFLLLIVAQAAHSIEEYVFRLYEVFGPARFISGLVSRDLQTGFAIANTALVAFGVWCYVARVRPARPSAPLWIWLWVVIELVNGIGHSSIALARREYFPGVATAPLLLAISILCVIPFLRRLRSPRREC